MNSNSLKKFIVTEVDFIKDEIVKEMEFHREDIVNIIMASYSINLIGAVTSRKSRTNPGLSKYVDTLRAQLMEADLVKFEGGSFSIRVPDEETLDFDSGPMRVIQTMLEGLAGYHVEIDAEQYTQMYNHPPRNLSVYDDTARKKDMIYIIKYTSDVKKRELAAFGKKTLEEYPFSNSSPVDIFREADDYVTDNMDDWIDNAKERATIRFKNKVGR